MFLFVLQLSQVEAWSFNQIFLTDKGTQTLGLYLPLFFSQAISKGLDWKWSIRNSKRHPKGVHLLQVVTSSTLSQLWPLITFFDNLVSSYPCSLQVFESSDEYTDNLSGDVGNLHLHSVFWNSLIWIQYGLFIISVSLKTFHF